jgi:hypothetical protein
MLKISILYLMILMGSCNGLYLHSPNTDKVSSADKLNSNNGNIVPVNTTANTMKSATDSELKQRIRRFYSYTNNDFRDVKEDEKFLKYIINSPHDKIVNELLTLQNEDKDDVEIQAKTSYLLIKLKYEVRTNQKTLQKTYSLYQTGSSQHFDRDYIINLIGDIIEFDDSDGSFLSDAFDLSLEVDGAYAESFSGIVTFEFKKNPKKFLTALKPKPKEIVDKVFSHIYYAERKEVILKTLKSIPSDFDNYDLVKQMQEYGENHKLDF